jgi:hypothetical protein
MFRAFSAACALTLGLLTPVFERLVEGELVSRRRLPALGRTTLIHLTQRGRVLQHLAALAVETEIMRQYSQQEAAVLVALVSRFYDGQSTFGEAAAGGEEGVAHLNLGTREFSASTQLAQ